MIDLKALKEQLKVLGHDLPDEQVVAILKEMKIDFNDKPDQHNDSKDPPGILKKMEGDAGQDTQSLPRTGSILDNFHGKQQPQQTHPSISAEACPSRSFNYGYTSPVAAPNGGVNHVKLSIGSTQLQSSPFQGHKRDAGQDRGLEAAGSEYSDDCYDHDNDEGLSDDPGVSCRYCTEETSQPTAAANGSYSAHPGLKHSGLAAPPASHRDSRRVSSSTTLRALGQPGNGTRDVIDCLGAVTFKEPVLGSANKQRGGQASGQGLKKDVGTARLAAAAQSQRPRSAIPAKDQHRKLYGLHDAAPGGRDTYRMLSQELSGRDDDVDEEDVEGDVALSNADKKPVADEGSSEDDEWVLRGRAAAGGRPTQDPYAAWLSGRGGPMAQRLTDAMLAQGQLSPQASNRSFASRATSRCSVGSKPGAKKVDRVQRYQQLQQEWSRNRFLKDAGGTSLGTSRKPVNFHSHFASLHAAEEAERQRLLRETRARTKKVLGAATEAPTANRRDELRWQTRMRLREQT